jgi:hypothetical protein
MESSWSPCRVYVDSVESSWSPWKRVGQCKVLVEMVTDVRAFGQCKVLEQRMEVDTAEGEEPSFRY